MTTTPPRIADPAGAGLRGLCPRCGRGHLFSGYLQVRPACTACGLDLRFADAGDGPAFFVMSITGILAIVVLAVLSTTFAVPAGLALIGSVLVAIVAGAALLRPAKGLLIGLQYKNDAAEGRAQ